VDADHFYRQGGGDGFTRRCKDCIKAGTRDRKTAQRESRGESWPKRCAGPCGRTIPCDAEHFARDPLGRPRPRCRECELAAELARDFESAADRPRTVPVVDTSPPDDGTPALGFVSDRQARLDLIRCRVDIAPAGCKADAAARARKLMAAADESVAELRRPPFDVVVVLTDMAEAAANSEARQGAGMEALASALRRLGWTPEAAR
jgi:hypothetical protein